MKKIRLLTGLSLVVVVLIAMAGTALAAPQRPPALPVQIDGTVQNINFKMDAGSVTGVDVTVLGKDNNVRTVTLSLDEALSLGLMSVDGNNSAALQTAMLGQSISVQVDETPTETPSVTPTATAEHPVGALIASFFGLEYSVVEGFHEEGSGFGNIASACWMSYQLKGDASLCGDILEAKKTGDYSTIELPDGVTVSNWGQFKKVLQEKGTHRNLGSIVSGHATPILTATPEPTLTPPPANQAGNGNGNGNDKTKEHGKGINNGKGPKK